MTDISSTPGARVKGRRFYCGRRGIEFPYFTHHITSIVMRTARSHGNQF